ncbi:MAG: hypothetical protein A2Z91_04440 [Deltaproteobacteria bacterium GWA2_38_16]|nr:MAG: hypothetical protein A2Z91_04440 [Deltaproteobacteria bacterium GWA2_38_16]OGQ01748.1 MAG: hypothetical protein A3D19_07740 [Deltaproteobacteria bacterium RIFCSPHIGHO2_02_FULL_38_15]OGQ33429.1 MAG: hypothetical protein A3A72_00610 [Deltaproteobacteria bacterium RIFCSPLOWO2_01_FULL_38_9]HBQ21449.1 hypothetical protein [Deltaproteobacteria bacterium]
MTSRKVFLTVGIFLAVIVLALVYLNRNLLTALVSYKTGVDFPNAALKIGESAPNLRLTDMEGKLHELKEYQGKVILINFWASWCPPCIMEMPALTAAYEKLKDKGFEILAISLDDDVKAAQKIAKESKLPFKIFLDPEGHSAQEYLVYGLPYTILLDREGKIQYKAFGEHTWDRGKDFERIQSLL